MPYTILFINDARPQTTFSLGWDGGASPATAPVDRSPAMAQVVAMPNGPVNV